VRERVRLMQVRMGPLSGAGTDALSAAAEAAGPHDGGACYSARMDFSRAC
jgi:hypothetical protein